MKKVALAQLKSENHTSVSIIEDVVSISPVSPKENVDGFGDVLADLSALKEALFFKGEKIRRKLAAHEQRKYSEIVGSIESYVRRLDVPPLGDSQAILEKNREILELKKTQKFIRYFAEIEKNSEQILGVLLNSEVSENWEFLTEIICYAIKYRKDKDNSVFIKYSKLTEQKMVSIFRTAVEEENYLLLKTAFRCLRNLGRERLLLDEYMIHIGMFKITVEISPMPLEIANFDDTESKGNAFDAYIDQIIEIIKKSISPLQRIFGKSPDYSEYFFRKIYQTIVYRALEKFLNVSSPIVFLISLEQAFLKMRDLGSAIQKRCQSFNPDIFLREGIERYVHSAVQNEKHVIDEMIDVMVHGVKPSREYVLLGGPVKYEKDSVEAFKKVLAVIDGSVSRCELMYSVTDEADLMKYYNSRLVPFVEIIAARAPSKIDAIKNLSFVFLILRRYFGDKFKFFKDLVSAVEDMARSIFSKALEQRKALIKQKVESLNFLGKESSKELLGLLKTFEKEAKELGGENLKTFVSWLLSETEYLLYKQIFLIVYTEDQGKNMIGCIEDFLGYATFLNFVDLIRRFSHLYEIGKLITVESDSFIAVYEEYKGSITDKELKDLVRCRRDKSEIRHLLGK